MPNKKLIAWQKATNALAQEFVNKYFDGTLNWRWTSGDIGGNFEINDYFFGLDRIVEAIEINCSYELLIQFYDYEMDCLNDKSLTRYNFKTWVKYYAGFGYGK
jgi:hypothetical protein